MERIGDILRETRERQGISFDQVEEEIMIKKRYLEAMENEDWARLPGKVYAKGFLRSYARFLKLNEQSIIDLYEVGNLDVQTTEAVQVTNDEPLEPRRRIELNNKPKKNMIIVFCVLAVALLFGSQWVYNRLTMPNEIGDNTPVEPAPDLPDTNPEEPGVEDEAPEAPAKLPRNTIDVVVLAQEEACWLRLRDGQQVLYEGTLMPGEKVSFNEVEQLNLRAGNAGTIQVTINDQILEPLAGFNQVVTRTYVVENDILKTIE